MPIRIEVLTEITIWLIIGVVAATLVFVFASIQRRISRRRYFEALDRARVAVKEKIDPLFEKEVDLEAAGAIVRSFRSKAERQAIEEAFFRHTTTEKEIALSRQILKAMGRFQEWIDILRFRARKPEGEAARILAANDDNYRAPGIFEKLTLWPKAGYMARCMVATKLARVPTPEGICAFLAGLSDPHPEVHEICIRNLGNSRDQAILPVLLEELVDVLEGRSLVSTRVIKTALVQFPLEAADGFLPVLEGTNRRARFFAVDVLREIADRRALNQGLLNKNDFSPALYRIFTEKLYQDDWGDVRARGAMVIAHFHDPTSHRLLVKLLQDKEWFVRLQACRSVSSKFFLPVARSLAERLTDKNWLVRESAVRSLIAMGDQGVKEILDAFISSSDPYTTEQISEELQRCGMLVTLLDSIGEKDQHEQAVPVVRKMIAIGKFSMVLAYLMSPTPSVRKLVLIDELATSTTPECQQTMALCADTDPDPKVRSAARAALQLQISLAAAADAAAISAQEGN